MATSAVTIIVYPTWLASRLSNLRHHGDKFSEVLGSESDATESFFYACFNSTKCWWSQSLIDCAVGKHVFQATSEMVVDM